MIQSIARRTLRAPATVRGTGLFTAKRSTLVLRPAEAGHGLKIHRDDMPYALPFDVSVRNVAPMPGVPGRNTVLAADPALITGSHNPFLATVEHVLSALAGAGITDALIECDGPEPPSATARRSPSSGRSRTRASSSSRRLSPL
jgi:UDP-3-O-[3-hydroxymyristoyl] N-acetylglucosamine deacetylase / 3-hydroxyacyl-[acyl-carrier-protein] dehydratase